VTAFRIGTPPRVLDAVLHAPASVPTAAAVVCHPHPEYGGTMENPVVVTTATALAARGVAALRFAFGRPFTGGPGELDDADAACDALRARVPDGTPLVLVGYSFGAWVALALSDRRRDVARVLAIAPPLDLLPWTPAASGCPVACVAGDRDPWCAPARLDALVGAGGGRVVARALAGADHFLAGREDDAVRTLLALLPS